MKRLLASSTGAIVVVFGIFVLMTRLILQEAPAITIDAYDFSNVQVFETPEKKKVRPKKIKPKLKQVKQMELLPTAVINNKTNIDVVDNHMPSLTKLKIGNLGNKFTSFGDSNVPQNGDVEATAVAIIEPNFPIKAKTNNLEGWVRLSYDITQTGRVNNVKVIESKPRGIFEQSARKALYKWRYKPSKVNGEAVASNGHVVMLEFNLEKD